MQKYCKCVNYTKEIKHKNLANIVNAKYCKTVNYTKKIKHKI